MSWTLFWDMRSGGGTKEGVYDKIYIEAPEDEAKVIFYNRFGHSSDRVSCTCCGKDYSVRNEPSLEQASAFHRDCEWVDDKNHPGGGQYVEEERSGDYYNYLTLDEYLAKPSVLVIRADEIKPEEREGDIPEQGYVWRD